MAKVKLQEGVVRVIRVIRLLLLFKQGRLIVEVTSKKGFIRVLGF